MDFARPRVLVSKCLGFAPCRYNGAVIPDDFVTRLSGFVDYLPVCPEVEIGLGVPRDPIRLVRETGGLKLVQPVGGKDCTKAMTAFAGSFFASAPPLDGMFFKSRSPSCGPVDVSIYAHAEKGPAQAKGKGLFASLAMERLPGAAVEHEGRVRNFRLREHFLTKLFTLADFRTAAQSGRHRDLTGFQAKNKLLFMAYNQTAMRQLGALAANREGRELGAVWREYQAGLARALARAPGAGAIINVLMHAAGYFKKQLNAREKALFQDMLEKYRTDKAPLSALQAVLQSWLARFPDEYLSTQSFFAPYPLELLDIGSSGKGRDLT